MASDGLWDTHTNEEVVDKIRKSMRSRFVQSRDVANRASKAIL
jgi:serine/threonine protein phosphatase PrpC